jgi:CheY-like chemotaxis protein
MSKKRILVVDDEPDVLTYLKTLFEDNGYETLSARNGNEALEQAGSQSPDLITLDMAMPDKTGVRAYRTLKEEAATKAIPVIIVTGVGEEMNTFLSKMKGFVKPEGFMAKPIDPEKLLAMASEILKS